MRIVLTRREALDEPDGVSIFIVSLAQALSELNHEVRIVVGCLRDEAEYRRLLGPRIDLPITALSRKPLTGPAALAAWLRGKSVIDRFAPDLIIHNEAVPLPFRGTTVQVVHDLEPRSGQFAPLWRSIRRYALRHCDRLVATTRELRDELVRDLGFAADRIALIPKCIDRQAYRKIPLSARERAILHAGTLPYKDPAATIRAFGALADPSVTLYITGPVTTPTRAALDGLTPPLRSRVILLGDADGETVRNLHGRVRVAAFPTRYTIPVASATVMEAVAAGTPVVGSPRISGDLLADGVNGLVVASEPDTIAAALRSVLNDDRLWMRLSDGAGRLVGRFDSLWIAGEYLELAADKSAVPAVRPAGFVRQQTPGDLVR